MLDARVDAVVDSSILASKVTAAKIEGAAGVYEVVTKAVSTSVSRVALAMSLLIKGEVASTDVSVMLETVQDIVRAQDTSKSTVM